MLANQPKNDTLYIKGFNIVVENRAFTYRQVAQNVGQKACLMPAHYGYLQNNPKVGVFVGAFPESDTVYLINQKAQGGYFDKHIAMFGFLSEQQAVDTYQKCFEYGYIGLMSVIPCTLEQLKWWLINGDKSRPVTKERLPYAGLERLDSVLWGGEDKADLASHSGQVAKLLYQIRQSDSFNHALEPLSYHDLTQELGNQGFVYENYDALVIEYNKLERKTKQLLMAMQGAADIVKPVGVAVSKPLNKGGVSNVVAWFEMEDGQAVGVFFHNPDKTPKKIDPTDEMISYKWVLNKKDITIVVAPENGKDLVIRTVAKRIMKLVDANHDRFLKANSDKAELNVKEQKLNAEVIAKQSQLDMLNKDIEALEVIKQNNLKGISENGNYASLTFSDEKQKFVKTTIYLENKDLPKNGDYIVVTYEIDKRNKDPKSIGGVVDYGGDYDKILDVYANDNVNKYGFSLLQRGTISKRLKKEIADLEAEKESKFIDNPKKKLGDEDKFTLPTNSTVILDLPITAYRPEKMRVVEREAENATFYEVDAFSENMSKWINLKSYTDKEKAILGAKGWYPEIITEEENKPQDRPSNWRTNLANARAVAKSLGIETKGKKLNTLLKEIDVFDENEVKKELLAEFKDLASRLVLPKGYVFDLTDAEKSISNAGVLDLSAWIKKQGKIDTNSIRIELRTIPDSSQDVIFNSVHFYTDDKKTKTKLDKLNYPRYDDIGTSKPTTPKTIVEKMEQFLINAVFPEIEYLKVENSTNVDVSKLSEIGIAEITDIGNENLYFEKDGKYYISKVGNPQLYALGKWDFAKYPDGVVSQATEPKQPESEPLMTNSDRVKFSTPKDILDSNLTIDEKLVEAQKLFNQAKSNTAKNKVKFDESNKFYLQNLRNARGGYLYTDLPKNASLNSVIHASIGITAGFIEFLEEMKANQQKDAISESEPVAEIGDTVIGDMKLSDLFKVDMAKKSNGSPELRIARQSILDAEDAAKIVIDTGDIDAFKKFADIFPSTHKALLDMSKLNTPKNPDRDYLQSIIEGSMIPKSSDMDAVIELTQKYEDDDAMLPLLEQALEKINQTQQKAVKEAA